MPFFAFRGASGRPGGLLSLAALVAVGAMPGRAVAQRVTSTLDVQGTRLRYADTVDATATGISPSLRLDWSHALLSASGTYAQLSSAWSADGGVDGALFTPSRGPLSAELAGTVSGSTHQDGTRTGMAIGMGRLHLDGESAGLWSGATCWQNRLATCRPAGASVGSSVEAITISTTGFFAQPLLRASK